MQPDGPPCGNINPNLVLAIQHLYDEAISAFQMNSTHENGSEQQLELGKDVFSHPPPLTFFLKGVCLMVWKNMMKTLG